MVLLRFEIKNQQGSKEYLFFHTGRGKRKWFYDMYNHKKKKKKTVELQWLEHWWFVYHGCFELVLESLIVIWDISGDFLFILIVECCVYSLESPRWGDSNENTQYTFILQKIDKISLLSLLTLRYIINPHWLELHLSRTKFHGLLWESFDVWKWERVCLLEVIHVMNATPLI